MENVKIIRAVGSEFIRRKYSSVVVIYLLVTAATIALIVWLVNISEWWWILGIFLIGLILLGAILLFAVRLLIKVVRPQLNREQKNGVSEFVDKLERVAESVQTPPFIIFFYIARDTMWPKDQTFIRKLAQDGTTLHTDFIQLQRLFK